MVLQSSVSLRDPRGEVSSDNHARLRFWDRWSTLLSEWKERFVAFLGHEKERPQSQAISRDSAIIDNDRSAKAAEQIVEAAPKSKRMIRLKK